MELYEESLDFERYVKLEQRVQKELPALKKRLTDLKVRFHLTENFDCVSGNAYCTSTSVH
jgi:hypothetical protein